MKIYSTKKLLILFSVVAFVLLGVHFLVFNFFKNTATEVLLLESDVASLEAQVLEFSKFSSEDLKQLADSVTAKFVPRTDFVAFIQNLETKGRNQKLEVSVRSVDNEGRSTDVEQNKKDDKEFLRLKLETVGSWSNTMKFVNYVEHLPYKISINGLSLTKLANEGGDKSGGESSDASGSTSGSSSSNSVSVNLWKAEIEIIALKLK